MEKVMLAPTCPDCGQECQHPLTMPVECPTCGGEPFVVDPLASVGFGFGASSGGAESDCTQCKGARLVQPPPPTDEQVRAAENRWTCSGGAILPVVFVEEDGDDEDGLSFSRRSCPGRDDVEAPPELWAEIKRSWRTRTKTTVVAGIPMYGREPTIVSGTKGALKFDPLSIYHMMPDGTQNLKGKRTIVVTFEPDEESP